FLLIAPGKLIGPAVRGWRLDAQAGDLAFGTGQHVAPVDPRDKLIQRANRHVRQVIDQAFVEHQALVPSIRRHEANATLSGGGGSRSCCAVPIIPSITSGIVKLWRSLVKIARPLRVTVT